MKWIYTAPEDAVELLRSRRKALKPPADYLEQALSGGEYAVLARQVASPNFEAINFARKAAACGLKPLILEYSEDKFSGENVSKLSCGILEFEGSKLIEQFIACRVAAYLGKPISTVKTLWGQPLLEFHHDMFKMLPELAEIPTIDCSRWLHEHGRSAKNYYVHYLSLFVCHGVLFETFPDNLEEGGFTQDIVIPAIKQATEIHGEKPLIVPLDPPDDEAGEHWYRYPSSLENFVRAKLGRDMVESAALEPK
ncbi:MAG: hypothetical protein A2X49_08635 [Lentisphaerae bacterium GWF2_52_8]|nr:MAG: hypothetical protein A2X49_08635 [Lentisphaerae bacterium GWF2_52_8]